MVNTMPYDYRWPRFEDLELVRIGDWFVDACGDERRVAFIEFHKRYLFIHTVGEAVCFYNYGERVKRPQIMAADGKPLEVGQTVWHTKTGAEYRVLSLPDGEKGAWLEDSGEKYFLDHAALTHQRPVLGADGVPIKKGDTVWHKGTGEKYRVFRFSDEDDRVWGESDLGSFFLDCSMLTHQRPVLAADGVPIKVWDTVYDINDGTELVITSIELDGLDHVKARQDKPVRASVSISPLRLTHTKPEIDSWERIEDDATLDAAAYCDRRGIDVEEGHSFVEPMARDLVRRCKEVARKENSNE